MKDGDILDSPFFYLDTSAIAKRYYPEQGTDFVCEDGRLCDAAASEGIKVLRPTAESAWEYLRSLENG